MGDEAQSWPQVPPDTSPALIGKEGADPAEPASHLVRPPRATAGRGGGGGDLQFLLEQKLFIFLLVIVLS